MCVYVVTKAKIWMYDGRLFLKMKKHQALLHIESHSADKVLQFPKELF